jgi:hypothetical protein
LLFRQLFLKRPPAPAPTPSAQPVAPVTIQTDLAAERFKNVEAEYFRLRGQVAANRITRAQLEATLKEMMLQDAQGRWWTLGVDSGKWYVRQGETWIESNPPVAPTSTLPQVIVVQVPAQTPAPTYAQTQSSGCSSCSCLVMGTLVLILLAALTAAAGFGLLSLVSVPIR